MPNESCASENCGDQTAEEYEKYGTLEYLEEEVGWFYFRGDYRVLQPLMKWCFFTIGRSGIESPMSIALIPLALYYIMTILFTICDFYGRNWTWIQQYKIQKQHVPAKAVWKAAKLTMLNQLFLISPILTMQYVTGEPKFKAHPLAPPLFEFVFQVTASTFLLSVVSQMSIFLLDDFTVMVCFDFQYYVWHRLHHKNRRLYKWCHMVHHEFHTCQASCGQYLHPWELLCLGIYAGVVPKLFGAHWLTMMAFAVINVYTSVLDHCGYDLPIDLHNIFGRYLYGGARKHDMHHMKPFTNFQPFFSTFDRWMGDECPGMLPGSKKPQELIDYEKHREQRALEWYKRMPEKHVENDDSYRHF